MAIVAFVAEFLRFLCLSPSTGVLEGALLEVLRLRRFPFGFIDSIFVSGASAVDVVASDGATKVF